MPSSHESEECHNCPGSEHRILSDAAVLNDKAFKNRSSVMQSKKTKGNLCAASPGLANPVEIMIVF